MLSKVTKARKWRGFMNILSDIEEIKEILYINGQKAMQKWCMVRLNKRLWFLCYPEGGFFRKHIDGCYKNEENRQWTFYTLQLYLPSDSSGLHESFEPAKGGQSQPGAGVSAHHVVAYGRRGGVKCAMCLDILYEKVGKLVHLKTWGVGPQRCPAGTLYL
ncbi:hypothetical protein C8R44DRAFT_735201 [Mycena epipterygia]|nr:hypothetical protein C8R44DRAFT_735201 [Mycena epipterygia]